MELIAFLGCTILIVGFLAMAITGIWLDRK